MPYRDRRSAAAREKRNAWLRKYRSSPEQLMKERERAAKRRAAPGGLALNLLRVQRRYATPEGAARRLAYQGVYDLCGAPHLIPQPLRDANDQRLQLMRAVRALSRSLSDGQTTANDQ